MFSRRIDNTNPTVTMGALPAWVDGTITLTSTPADGGGIASVAVPVQAQLHRVVDHARARDRLLVPDLAVLVLVQHDAG